MYQYLILDVDGTFLDTEATILKSLQKVLAWEGMDYSFADLKFVLGIPEKKPPKIKPYRY